MKRKNTERVNNEIRHFSTLKHIWWGARTKAGQRRYDNRFLIFKKLCKPNKDNTILEIGCGDGEFTKRLADLPSKIVGTDITPKVIARAKRYFNTKIYRKVSFKADNAEKMSFSNNSFDIVCGISILHHIDTNKALKESFRVLKRGGSIFFSEPNLINPNIYLGLNVPYLRRKMEYSNNETALIRWNVEAILKSIGYRYVHVINYDFLHPLTPICLADIVEKIGKLIEKTPLIKEISGSLLIYAKK